MTPTLTPSTKPVVGKFYMVPCMHVNEPFRTRWIPRDGWVPVIGPKHIDAEFLEFNWNHYHIDWRFLPAPQFRRVMEQSPSGSPLGHVLTSDTEWSNLTGVPALRRLQCRREMPEFQGRGNIVRWGEHIGRKWERMERAQAFVCNKLKPGNICPHRGIDLTPFIKDDGTVICPGHGLRWDTKTGEQLPHHASAA